MGAAREAVAVFGDRAEDAEADAADEADVDDAAVAETGGSEIDVDACWEDEITSGSLTGEECHEEVLKQSLWGGDGDVDPLGGIAGLLQEDSRGGGLAGKNELADIDWDAEALAGEDRVHDGNVLVRKIGRGGEGEEEDARL